jgi:hypothetical protein
MQKLRTRVSSKGGGFPEGIKRVIPADPVIFSRWKAGFFLVYSEDFLWKRHQLF